MTGVPSYRLATALRMAANRAEPHLVGQIRNLAARVERGDFDSSSTDPQLSHPKTHLVEMCLRYGLEDIADRITDGEFDD